MVHSLRVFLCASVYASGLHHSVEKLGLLGFGGKEIQTGLQGKKGRDPQPHQLDTPLARVISAASLAQISFPQGTWA